MSILRTVGARPAGIGLLVGLTFVALLAGGCRSGALPMGDRIRGTTLTVYVSVPLSGGAARSARGLAEGARAALGQIHERVGRYRIVMRMLNDSALDSPGWDPGQTTVNARVAGQDPTTIGYIGDDTSGASAVSIPLLAPLGIPQISPTSTAVGLTSAAAGAAPGEPDKYYPTRRRNFARVIPNDAVQATVQVRLQQRRGCRRTYVLDDGELEAVDMADSFELVARSAGLTVLGIQAFPPRAGTYDALAAAVAQSGADCVLMSALTDSGAADVAAAVAAVLPRAQIFATARLAEPSFLDPAAGGIPLGVDPRVLLTVPARGRDPQPAAAHAFTADEIRRFGAPPPGALQDYEAMSLLLAALSRATDGGRGTPRRSRVLWEIFHTRRRASVLGTYSIDANGDTTSRRYGIARVLDGKLRYWRTVDG